MKFSFQLDSKNSFAARAYGISYLLAQTESLIYKPIKPYNHLYIMDEMTSMHTNIRIHLLHHNWESKLFILRLYTIK